MAGGRLRGRIVGAEFGHHLGLSRALSGLPLSPLVPGYGELAALQHAVGLRHLGEALVGPGRPLRVLDGLFVPRAPRGWQRLDGAALARLRSAGGDTAELLGRLETLYGEDGRTLRRVVLYQLIGLLQDHPRGGRAETAVALGADPDEAGALVHAARVRPRLDARARAAAEELEDAWEHRRLRHAARLAARLPEDGGQDTLLAARRDGIAARVRETDAALDEADRLRGEGDLEAAAEHYLHAARLTADSRRAVRGLVGAHLPARGTPAPLRAELGQDDVSLDWHGPAAQASAWRVVRFTRHPGRPSAPSEVQASAPGATARDGAPPLGRVARYAVLPLRDGFVDGPPLVAHPLLIAPDVTGLRVTDGRERVDATWTAPPGAGAVVMTLTGPDGRGVGTAGPPGSAGSAGGGTARGLAAGDYRARVVCRYRPGDGDEVSSAGVEAGVRVHPWPDPVRTLTAVPHPGGGVRFTWTGGEGAAVELAAWPGEAPAPGTDLPPGGEPLPSPLPWPDRAGTGTAERPADATGDHVRGAVPASADGTSRAGAASGHRDAAPSGAPAEPALGTGTVERPADAGVTDAGPPPDGTATHLGRVLFPPPGTVARVTAVAVLGERAVAGPSVRVEALRAVRGLRAERVPGGHARIDFDWPEGAGQVRVVREQDGRSAELLVTRTAFLRGGLSMPVGPGTVRVHATPVARPAEAVALPPAGAEVVLPPDMSISYRVAPGSRLPLLRRRPVSVTVTVTLSAPDLPPPRGPAGGEAAAAGGSEEAAARDEVTFPISEFVLVARPGDGRTPPRPRHAADGVVVLRVTGAELADAGTVEREIEPTACRPPFALRGFLLGGRAASVRLEEPVPAHLVVR